ncbi:MAG: nucleoside hydrolase, partial [Planctomycetes bacterium]|nr:nucleoside hydrolase [Planctomycetota bacterium]
MSDLTSLLKRLEVPTGMVDVVLDTDTYNEIDDQFALAYMLRSQEKLRAQAVYAAPFFNQRSTGPADGMEKSYQEIHKVVDLVGAPEMKNRVFRGSPAYLPDEKTPVESSAARDLVERALAHAPENPLYVVAIGA